MFDLKKPMTKFEQVIGATFGFLLIALVIMITILAFKGEIYYREPPKQERKEDPQAELRVQMITQGQILVQSQLLDPDSVQWVAKKINRDNFTMCFAFRAKNAYGGLTNGVAVIVNGDLTFDSNKVIKNCPQDANYENF